MYRIHNSLNPARPARLAEGVRWCQIVRFGDQLGQHDQVEVFEASEPDACCAEFHLSEATGIAVGEVGVVDRSVDVDAVVPLLASEADEEPLDGISR